MNVGIRVAPNSTSDFTNVRSLEILEDYLFVRTNATKLKSQKSNARPTSRGGTKAREQIIFTCIRNGLLSSSYNACKRFSFASRKTFWHKWKKQHRTFEWGNTVSPAFIAARSKPIFIVTGLTPAKYWTCHNNLSYVISSLPVKRAYHPIIFLLSLTPFYAAVALWLVIVEYKKVGGNSGIPKYIYLNINITAKYLAY